MENPRELIGILQAISIIAKNLAEKLMRIDKEIKDYESSRVASTRNKTRWKGKR